MLWKLNSGHAENRRQRIESANRFFVVISRIDFRDNAKRKNKETYYKLRRRRKEQRNYNLNENNI
jgi:hypothetical protein